MIRTIKNSIPNLFTLANLSCGLLGIISLFEREVVTAAYLIWLAALFDFLDGFLARVLRAQSEIGKQLDSLADLVTFGALPALIYYQLLEGQFEFPWRYLSIMVVLFSALRLAKFNTDSSQTTSFSGLTTTANGILTSSIPVILAGDSVLSGVFEHPIVLLLTMVFFSSFMVVPVRLFSFKLTHFNWKQNLEKIIFILISIPIVILFRESSVPMIISIYLAISVIMLVINPPDKIRQP